VHRLIKESTENAGISGFLPSCTCFRLEEDAPSTLLVPLDN